MRFKECNKEYQNNGYISNYNTCKKWVVELELEAFKEGVNARINVGSRRRRKDKGTRT
jgi:hypothetical protein